MPTEITENEMTGAKAGGNRGTGGRGMKLTLTASSMACALRCPRRYFYENILGLKVAMPSEALRIGTAVHNAGEARAHGKDFAGQYAAALEGTRLDEWMAARVFGIVGAYDRTYGETEDRDYAAMNPEVEFTDPIDGSRTFVQRGKVDGLAVLRDGRRVNWERKTTSDDLAETGDYWQRLRLNHQLLAYAAWEFRATGELPTCVYDVIRKPMLQPKANVPELDETGLPIVLDAAGNRCVKRDGTPKKTADAAKGERVAGHPETPDEYGARILDAMSSEAERYFARREVAITADMLEEFHRERLGVCRMLLHFAAEARKAKLPEYAYPRSCSPDNCRNCAFAGFCLERLHVDAANPPEGFVVALHQELSSPQGAEAK